MSDQTGREQTPPRIDGRNGQYGLGLLPRAIVHDKPVIPVW